jgi:ribosomal protein L7/L12
MPELFKCPSCGAPLDYNHADSPTIRCTYCDSSIILPEELRPRGQAAASFGLPTGQVEALQEIALELQAGRKINAIKIFRETFGVGLKEAKDAVEAMEAGQPVVVAGPRRQLQPEELRGSGQTVPATGFGLSREQTEALGKIALELQAGRKINAIKIYREAFGVGLKEAKDAVEAIEAGQPVVVAGFKHQLQYSRVEGSTGAAPAGLGRRGLGCLILLVLLLVILPPLLFLTPVVALLGFSANNLAGVSATVIALSSPTPAPTPRPTHTPAPTPTPAFADLAQTFGGEGIGPGQFSDARHIAVDGEGYIYVGEWVGGSRIQRFDPSGKFVSLWTVTDPKAIVTDLAADRQGNVYVIQGRRLYHYNSASGELLGEITYGSETAFEAIAPLADGGLAVFWRGGFADTIVRYDVQGNPVQTIDDAISGQTEASELNPYLAVDGLGNIYATGSFSSAVFKYGPDGSFINRFGSKGDEPGQFRTVMSIAVDSQGRVYVGDAQRIHVFAADGRFLNLIELDGLALGLAFNDKNELFIASRTEVLKHVLNRQ